MKKFFSVFCCDSFTFKNVVAFLRAYVVRQRQTSDLLDVYSETLAFLLLAPHACFFVPQHCDGMRHRVEG